MVSQREEDERSSEEEEEEEEEDTLQPVQRSSGFKMMTQQPSQQPSKQSSQANIHQEPHMVEHAVESKMIEQVTIPNGVRNEDTMKEQEAHMKAEEERRQAEVRQAQLKAQREAQRQIQEKAQQEALIRAQQIKAQAEAQAKAQQEAIQRAQQAQAQAQKEAQMRAQQAHMEAQLKAQAQKEAQLKAQQVQAQREAQLRTQQMQVQAKVQQEARSMAQKEAQLKAAQTQQETKNLAQMEALQAREAQNQVQQQQKLAQQQQAKLAQQQQQHTKPTQQQQQNKLAGQQLQLKFAQQQQHQLHPKYTEYQTKQQPPEAFMNQQRNVPQPPPKPAAVEFSNVLLNQSAQISNPANDSIKFVKQSRTIVGGIIRADGEKIRALRGGDVQQIYLNNFEKPVESPQQQQIKPIQAVKDNAWVTQTRIAVSDIQLPLPAKISIPELHGSVDVRPTVIVPRPTETTKVEWNEFPAEEVKDKVFVPKIKTQEWNPDQQREIVGSQSMRSAYRPGRIGRVWPPPQDENQPPPSEFRPNKAADDTAWIHDDKITVEKVTTWNITHQMKEPRVWPPPEVEIGARELSGSRLPAVQWPPPEFEQQMQQEIEVLQTKLPIRPHQRKWPPAPPQYQAVEIVEQHVHEQVPRQTPPRTMPKTSVVTKRMVHA